MNETIVKFGHPATLIAEYEHWVVLLRPAQPTLGALILAAKSDATAFGDLPTEAHTELKTATAAIEAALTRAVGYAKINRSEEHTSELQSLMRLSYAVI